MNLSILYRGPLSSCNYACGYCPFAKHQETRAEHQADERALNRFIDWVDTRPADRLSVFFTPWGEALIRRRYQQALVRLTQMPHIDKAAIQTNLSCRLDWVDDCDKQKLGLWATYHPGETDRRKFAARCLDLHRRGVRVSVGVVGMQEHLDEIEAIRAMLPENIYVWVNAYKRVAGYYSDADIARITAIDPLFPINNTRHPSLGKACLTGRSVVSVDGDGTMRRCHFVKTPIGNIYDPQFTDALIDRVCTNQTCGCHIGYVHMPDMNLYDVFRDGILERIPASPLWIPKPA